MKNTLMIIAISSIISLLITGCIPNPGYDGTTSATPEAQEERVYEVFGMDCPGCHGGLTKLVNEIEGVADSVANWEEKTLVVYLEDGADVSDEQIIDAIERANFTFSKRLK